MSKGGSYGDLPGSLSGEPVPLPTPQRIEATRSSIEHVQQKGAPPLPRDCAAPAAEEGRYAVSALTRGPLPGVVDVSVLLGTVRRPDMVRACIEAIRAAVAGLTYEIVVAYGDAAEPALPWLGTQPDVITAEGGMDGAIPAFNAAYAASRGLLVCQINDDVLVGPGSIWRAVAHLDAHPACAGVVFHFDRGEGHGLRHEYLGEGLLHPNQMVARRSTCEAVVEILGAFWGDAAHRTHKTYGGDSAFGVVCHHLGLRLDSVQDVTCRDRQHESDDDLRLRNRPPADHAARWHAMFQPLLETRAAARPGPDPGRADRLRALDPQEGHFPARAWSRRERVLHVHLATPDDPQAGLVRALSGLGDYGQVDWPKARERGTLAAEILALANRLRPTLVFMQLQTANVVGPDLIAQLRPLLAPRGVVATWCGDVAAENSPWTVGWQVPLGQAVDLTLHTSLTHVQALRAAGIPGAAYLQIGYDAEQYRPTPMEPVHDVVFLGNRYYSPSYLASLQQHDAGLREAVIFALREALGPRFGLYGSGHEGGLGGIPLARAHEAYWRSRMGLNVSLCNFFGAYSSDRIFRILGCGALLLTKRFPLMSSYGLTHGDNCLIWDTPAEAVALARAYLAPERAAERAQIAAAGARLAAERHTWEARMGELAALLQAARGGA